MNQTLDKNNFEDITFEGESIYFLQELIQELGLYNEDIVYKMAGYNSFTIEIKDIEPEELDRLEEADRDDILYEEVLTLDVECNDGVVIHINKGEQIE